MNNDFYFSWDYLSEKSNELIPQDYSLFEDSNLYNVVGENDEVTQDPLANDHSKNNEFILPNMRTVSDETMSKLTNGIEVLWTKTQRKISKRENPFIIITERKLFPDAIQKKIFRRFYKWLIENISKTKHMKFNKLSKDTIKKIKKSEVSQIMNESLLELLKIDKGSKKYKRNINANKAQVEKIIDSKDEELIAFFNRTVDSFYEEFIKSDVVIEGPSLFRNTFDFIMKNYLHK